MAASCWTATRARCNRCKPSMTTSPRPSERSTPSSLSLPTPTRSWHDCSGAPQIEGRSDDNEETIRVRLQVYAEQTEPLLEVYRPRGLLVEVDGLGEIDDVSERVFAALDAHREGHAAELVDSS